VRFVPDPAPLSPQPLSSAVVLLSPGGSIMSRRSVLFAQAAVLFAAYLLAVPQVLAGDRAHAGSPPPAKAQPVSAPVVRPAPLAMTISVNHDVNPSRDRLGLHHPPRPGRATPAFRRGGRPRCGLVAGGRPSPRRGGDLPGGDDEVAVNNVRRGAQAPRLLPSSNPGHHFRVRKRIFSAVFLSGATSIRRIMAPSGTSS